MADAIADYLETHQGLGDHIQSFVKAVDERDATLQAFAGTSPVVWVVSEFYDDGEDREIWEVIGVAATVSGARFIAFEQMAARHAEDAKHGLDTNSKMFADACFMVAQWSEGTERSWQRFSEDRAIQVVRTELTP